MADNQFVSAWRTLRAAQIAFMKEGGTTRNPQLAVDGVTCNAVIGENSADFSFFGGGISSGGQMTIQTILADWAGNIPQKAEIATLTGMAGGDSLSQQVLNTIERNGILYVVIGDTASQ